MGKQRPFPIVEYAHKINKNTAEFTVNDLVAFMKWWIKQPVRKDILAMKNEYEGLKKAGKDRMPKDVQEAMEEQTQEAEQDPNNIVVVELGLTQLDVDALKWALLRIFEDYDVTESAYGEPLTGLKTSLDSL